MATGTAERIYSTGKRKNSVARVWLTPSGDGKLQVNSLQPDEYFRRPSLVSMAKQPLTITNLLKRVDITATTCGGGLSGQAGALRHGIATALIAYDPALRPILRKSGLLTRDPRSKERKKYGLRGARKRTQYSKR